MYLQELWCRGGTVERTGLLNATGWRLTEADLVIPGIRATYEQELAQIAVIDADIRARARKAARMYFSIWYWPWRQWQWWQRSKYTR